MKHSETDMKKLEDDIGKISKGVGDSSVFLNVKKRLMNTIECEYAFSKTKIPVALKARVRERLMAFIEGYSAPKFLFHRFFSAHKQAWVSLAIFAIVINTFVFVDTKVPVTYAKYTVLQEVNGNVYVDRGSETLMGENEFALEEGDTVRTDVGSRAIIKFFDKSVSRLNENTEVVLSRLFIDRDTSESGVVLGVRDGQVWSRVNESATDTSEFIVRSSDVMARAKDNSAFNVSANSAEKEFEVEVYEEEVDVRVVSNEVAESKSVAKGSKAFVRADEAVGVQIEDIFETNDWIAVNLDKDAKHIEQIIEETKEEVKGQTSDVLSPIRRIKEDAKLLVTFDKVEKEKLKLEIAEKGLLEAEALLADGRTEEAMSLIDEFNTAVQAFKDVADQMKETNPVKYVDLKVYLDAKLNKHNINIGYIYPDVSDEDVSGDEPKDGFIKPLLPVVEEEEDVAPPNLNLFLDAEQAKDDSK
ncbi:MAG: DUF5667 domain-containing protein [Patescibacteria group bacterium]